MKALKPEMVRLLKELHKIMINELTKIMALLQKGVLNPMSGCLPILVQFLFFLLCIKF